MARLQIRVKGVLVQKKLMYKDDLIK